MRFLLGDSTDAGLEVNYLQVVKDVIDCSVGLLEHEGMMATAGDRRRTLERDATIVMAALKELGERSTELAEAVAKEHHENSIGRCAEAIVASTRVTVETELADVRAVLAADLAKVAQDDQALRAKGAEGIDKLLRAHELPAAERITEVTWAAASVTAVMRQKTPYGVEATVGLEIPAGSELTVDLRVDRLAEHAELATLEVGGGWLKKSDKLVPYKIGRYHVVKVTAGAAGDTVVRLRATADLTSAGFELVRQASGEVAVETVTGEPVRELTIDPAQRGAVVALVTKLDAAVRGLADRKTGLVQVTVDGKAVAEQARSGVLAERLIHAIAPTVKRIAAHSRNPDELVLRRMLGEDRREEIFVPVADLTRRWAKLPDAARDVFAQLGLHGDPAAPRPEVSGPQRRVTQTSAPTNVARAGTAPPPPQPPSGRSHSNTAGMPGMLVAPASASTRAVTRTIPAAVAPAPTPAPSPSTSGTTSTSVMSKLPSPTSAAVTPGAVALASVWGVAGEPEPEASAAGAEPGAAAVPAAVDEELAEDADLVEEVDEDGTGARATGSQPTQNLSGAAESQSRNEQSRSEQSQSRQARLDRLNDPVQHARLSAAIEAALGDIDDDKPGD